MDKEQEYWTLYNSATMGWRQFSKLRCKLLVGVNHWEHDSAHAAGLPDPREDPVVEQDVEGGLKTSGYKIKPYG